MISCFMFSGEVVGGNEPYIPYVPYPINPSTGSPVETRLKALENKADLKFGGPMSDPKTGLHVPISAVTIHPQTGALLPIAGTHMDPVTSLPVAIEIGSLMVCPDSEMPVPILAIGIDPNTGKFFFCGYFSFMYSIQPNYIMLLNPYS